MHVFVVADWILSRRGMLNPPVESSKPRTPGCKPRSSASGAKIRFAEFSGCAEEFNLSYQKRHTYQIMGLFNYCILV